MAVTEYTHEYPYEGEIGVRSGSTVASGKCAHVKLDSNRRAQVIDNGRQCTLQLLHSLVNPAEDSVITDHIYTNKPADALNLDGKKTVTLVFFSDDPTGPGTDDFLAYIQLWPASPGSGIRALALDVDIGATATTANPATGATGTTFYPCDEIDIKAQAVAATAYDHTAATATLVVTVEGWDAISCQFDLDGGDNAVAALKGAYCYALLPVSTN